MAKIEATHLLTLSAYVDSISKQSYLSHRQTQEIIDYNNFLKQELKVEMFDNCSEESIFSGFGICSVTGEEWIVGRPGTNFFMQFNRKTGISSHNWTLAKLAELTKDFPLKFRQMSIYYEFPYQV